MKLSKLGEDGLLARIQARFARQRHSGLILGPGDDAAVSRLKPGHVLVSTHDDLAEGTHFLRKWTDFRRLAHKLLRINLSDLAAMGAVEPVGVLCGAGFPREAPASWALDFLKGLSEDAARFKVPVLGGNLARSERLFFSMTALGQAKPEHLLKRSTARAGDLVYGIGPVGESRPGKGKAFWEPEPQLAAGAQLAKKKLATALIDNSDGLMKSCRLIARDSNLKFLAETKMDSAGEDYGLVFSVPPRKEAALRRALPKAYRLGTLVRGRQGKTGGFDHYA